MISLLSNLANFKQNTHTRTRNDAHHQPNKSQASFPKANNSLPGLTEGLPRTPSPLDGPGMGWGLGFGGFLFGLGVVALVGWILEADWMTIDIEWAQPRSEPIYSRNM